jgi:hypothetical protein
MPVRMTKMSPDLQTYADNGLKLCRDGDWNKGLSVLAAVLDQRTPLDQVPGIIYSYLGYGVARYQGKLREGLKLCEHSLKIQYYEAENHWNLARVQALAGERQAAHQTIEHGLKLDPDHAGLIATQKELGVRKKPILWFLGRDNPINVMLGKWRHSISQEASSQPPPDRLPPSQRRAMGATGTATPRPMSATGSMPRPASATGSFQRPSTATPPPRNRPPGTSTPDPASKTPPPK